MKHLKLQRAHRDAVSLAVEIHAAEGDPGQFAFQREQLGLRAVKIRLMDIDRRRRQRLHQSRHCTGVVIVAVGQQDLIHGAVQLFGGGEDQLRLRTGIDHGADLSRFIAENVAVGTDGPSVCPTCKAWIFIRHTSLKSVYSSVSNRMVTGPSFWE